MVDRPGGQNCISGIGHERGSLPTVRLVTTSEYLSIERPQLDWLVDQQVPFPGTILLQGPPKSGKSFLALDLARCVSLGHPFLGWKTKPSKTLYLQFDTGEMAWRKRLQNWKDANIDLSGPLFTVHPEDIKIPINITNPLDRSWLKEIVQQADPALTVIDVLREIHNADENDSTEMKIVGDILMSLFQGRSLVIVHHSKKLNDDFTNRVDLSNAARGSSYLTGKVDALWLLWQNQLYIQNRTSEPTQVKLYQTPVGIWDVAKDIPSKKNSDLSYNDLVSSLNSFKKF